jgi:hypothetical protein
MRAHECKESRAAPVEIVANSIVFRRYAKTHVNSLSCKWKIRGKSRGIIDEKRCVMKMWKIHVYVSGCGSRFCVACYTAATSGVWYPADGPASLASTERRTEGSTADLSFLVLQGKCQRCSSGQCQEWCVTYGLLMQLPHLSCWQLSHLSLLMKMASHMSQVHRTLWRGCL